MDVDVFANFTAAAVHAAPVILDRDATIDKMASFVADARRGGAALVVFPESFLPGFPLWALIHAPIDQHAYFRRWYEASIEVPGPHTRRLGLLARRHGIYLSVGVSERSQISMGGLYNTNLLFDPDGQLISAHRKIVPTWAEKLVWTGGDGTTLRPVSTKLGRIGTLICGENTNPLARYALMAQGEQIHVSTYPPVWPFRRTSNDIGRYQRWIELRAAAHSFEGKLFTIVAAGHLDEAAIRVNAGDDEKAERALREAGAAATLIVGADGEVVAGPHSAVEGIVLATVDVASSIEAKLAHDVVGNYQRFDLFRLELDQRPQQPITLVSDPTAADSPRRAIGTDKSDESHHTSCLHAACEAAKTDRETDQ